MMFFKNGYETVQQEKPANDKFILIQGHIMFKFFKFPEKNKYQIAE